MGTFTPEDVAVGDTVHLIERHGDVTETHVRGEVDVKAPAWLSVKDTADRKWSGDWADVEIVTVEKPKRELVTGGIYEVTVPDAGPGLRRRTTGGWGAEGAPTPERAHYTDRAYPWWIIGRRVLLVDHPSERPGVAYDDLVTEAITRERTK